MTCDTMTPPSLETALETRLDGDADIQAIIRETQALIARRDYGQALAFLDASLDRLASDEGFAPVFRDDSGAEYRSFQNTFEEALYFFLHKPAREVKRLPKDFFGLYVLRGWLLFEMRRFDEAGDALKKAIRLNPINSEAVLELAEISKMHGDWGGFLDLTLWVLERAYTGADVGRSYRNLAFYCVEKLNYALAVVLLHCSRLFDPESALARTELLFIHELTGAPVLPPSMDEIAVALEASGLPFGGSEAVVGIALALGRIATKEGITEEVEFCEGVLREVAFDERILLADQPQISGAPQVFQMKGYSPFDLLTPPWTTMLPTMCIPSCP